MMGLAAKNAKSAKETWPMVRLGDIGTITRGSGIKRSETVERGRPCLRYGEIYTSFNVILDKPKSFVPQEVFDRSVHIKHGDLVFTLTGENTEEIAKTLAYLGDEEIAAGGDLAVWANHGCDPMYLAYLMYSPALIKAKADASNGQIIVHASVRKIQDIQIPLPPLSVQREIVARLEKELGEADALAAKFKEIAENADAEFKAELDETFKNVEGEKVRLGDVFKFIDYRGMTPVKTESGVPLITAKNVRQGFLDYKEESFISNEDYKNRQTRGIAHKGDILFTTEAPLGFVALADKDEFSTGQRIITFQQKHDNSNWCNKYFLYCLMSDWFQKQLWRQATGATAKGIKSSRLIELPVLVISSQCQKAIAGRLDKIKSECEKLKAAAARGLRAAEDLRKSILAEAFEQ